jgi:hypothetical protein
LEGSLKLHRHTTSILRLRSYDPYWSEIGDTADALTTSTTLAVEYIAARFNDAWDNLNPAAGNGAVRVVYVAKDKKIYVGGDFTNWNGDANADRIAVYDPATDAWSALGTGADAAVYAIIEAPDGSIYAGGAFTTIGGVTCRGVAKWNGSAWSALGPPSSGGTVYALCWGSDGKLYVGGTFTNWNGSGSGFGVVVWNGSAWANTVVSPNGGNVYALALDPQGRLYAAGSFDNFGTGSASKIARYSGSGTTWTDFHGANFSASAEIHAMAFGKDGTLFIGGIFTTWNSISMNRIAQWNGSIFSALESTGIAGTPVTTLQVNSLAVHPETGDLYIGGDFSTAGVLTSNVKGYVRWNGSVYSVPDIHLPGSAIVYSVSAAYGDLYVGFSTEGNATVDGQITATNNGTAKAKPVISIKRSGGTSASLLGIRNETTGDELMFTLALLDGETVIIDLASMPRRVYSDFGRELPASIVPSSDFSKFGLLPGANQISLFMASAGSPTLTANMRWRNLYWSVEGAN